MTTYFDPIQDDISKSGIDVQSIGRTQVAAGTTQATALLLAFAFNEMTTVASGAGVRLPNAYGTEIVVFNRGANACLVYPPVGASIDGGTVNAAVSIAANGKGRFVCVSEQGGVYYSA